MGWEQTRFLTSRVCWWTAGGIHRTGRKVFVCFVQALVGVSPKEAPAMSPVPPPGPWLQDGTLAKLRPNTPVTGTLGILASVPTPTLHVQSWLSPHPTSACLSIHLCICLNLSVCIYLYQSPMSTYLSVIRLAIGCLSIIYLCEQNQANRL